MTEPFWNAAFNDLFCELVKAGFTRREEKNNLIFSINDKDVFSICYYCNCDSVRVFCVSDKEVGLIIPLIDKWEFYLNKKIISDEFGGAFENTSHAEMANFLLSLYSFLQSK